MGAWDDLCVVKAKKRKRKLSAFELAKRHRARWHKYIADDAKRAENKRRLHRYYVQNKHRWREKYWKASRVERLSQRI